MSNDIDKELWRIQEQAMDKTASGESVDEAQQSDENEIREYQQLYELLKQQPEIQPPPLLADRVTKHISQRHSRQRASKLLTYLLCSLMALASVIGFFLLLPKSALLTQLSQSIPLPILLAVVFAVCVVVLIQKGLIKTNNKNGPYNH
ncbi:hypothetical protein [Kangiella koreensis]|uniref:Uncharacterized protein n=1 Tax=Kangiella koreensis (strain DSM 16069 / JCM 12317 / KCTC 12182 / SW-125) TaxID=523791 RepID=C7RD22_KANKD|nr:hypothetical protein [Kangiella koreensis]ACV27164.1 hypothetical protein Kkor_1752 [Kangiella koreensis DSM 16069]